MRISISSFYDVPLYYDKGITHIVSIGSPSDDFPPIGRFFGTGKYLRSILRLEFDDVDDTKPNLVSQTIDSGFLYPSREDIIRLVKYATSLSPKELEDAHVLFHCHAGISRSTAAAFVFLIALRYGEELKQDDIQSAWESVFSVRPIMEPNILMIKIADKVLNLNGRITSFAANQLNLSNYDTKNISTP